MEDIKRMTTFAIPNEKRHLFDGRKWFDSLAQLVEHNTFNVGVSGSSPERITKGAALLSRAKGLGRSKHNALLAQLVEQLTLNQWV